MAKRDVELDFIGHDKTGPAIRSVRGNLKKADKDLKVFSKMAVGIVSKVAPKLAASMAEAGTEAGGSLAKALASSVSSNPITATIGLVLGATIVATLIPVILAGITTGILMGLGGGVLGAGIAAAMEDPGIQSSFEGLKKKAKSVFADFGKPFVDPLRRAIGTISASLSHLAPSFNRIGSSMAPIIDKLAPALMAMAQRAMPGIERAVKASVPLFDALSESLPKLGDDMSKFFQSIADGGPGAKAFLEDFLGLTGDLIRLNGYTIEGGAKFYDLLGKFNDNVGGKFNDWMREQIGLADEVGDATDKGADGVRNLAAAETGMEAAATKAASALQGMVDKLIAAGLVVLSAREADRDYAEAIDEMTARLHKQGRGFDISTEKGRGNVKALDELMRKGLDVAKSQDDASMAGIHFSTAMQRGANDSFKAALSIGLTAQAALNLTKKVYGIPPSKTTLIEAKGAVKSKNDVAALGAEIARLKDKTVKIITRQQYFKDPNIQGPYVGEGRNYGGGLGGWGPASTAAAFASNGAWSGGSGGRGGRVSVSSTVNVDLDGTPFRKMTARAIDDSEKRQAWRTKVGRR